MAQLMFDTDQGRTTLNEFQACISNLEGELNKSQSSCNTLMGVWKAPAANQFEGEFQQCAQGLQQMMQMLQDVCQRLDREIQEWEAAAQGF